MLVESGCTLEASGELLKLTKRWFYGSGCGKGTGIMFESSQVPLMTARFRITGLAWLVLNFLKSKQPF